MLAGMVSCGWINEDLPECPPTELRLRFVYDYNMLNADAFSSQVGAVTVYVFDESNKLVTTKTEEDRSLLSQMGYEMVFDDSELVVGKKYRFVTVAFQKSSREIESTDGAKFRVADIKQGDPIEKLDVTLDREKGSDGRSYVVNKNHPLDTLWMSRTDNYAELNTQVTTRETVNLMRDTKNITLTLRQLNHADEQNIDIADYDISITDSNGWLNYDNSLKADEQLVYTPYALWNTSYDDEETRSAVIRYAAHADLSVSRLIYHDDSSKNARLSIRNTKTGANVAQINLPKFLSDGRSSIEQIYSPQEFLDREYAYRLDFFLRGDTWVYVDIWISISPYAVRIQNIGL